MKILIIEDEQGLLESILAYFTGEGNICEYATDFIQASEKIALYNYDCILLDLGLPGGEGLVLLDKIKKMKKRDGVLIISARHSLDDRLAGLDLGADDYLVKPFHLSELKARVSAIVRRKNFEGDNVIVFNEIRVDVSAMNVYVKEKQVFLTKKEFDLLVYFLSNKHKVVTKNAMAEHLWGDEMDLSDDFDFIYTHVKNLKKKLTEAGGQDYLRSVYGIGYKFGDL
ncbi:response regulator transcription factor [Pedobacter rhizosphaerae]|uniref:DNA-binding response regulator, OmpR family, contains REC and winged-helix (WHTH) domain n=1 Tax=Pedobacter rhizosphaerae TaxID=390241 RepID=A0A1H9U823_9SPHI|nr:response regulator transcription factor [Pedobacter rhizosphaerae]SES05411.1 DNA-binding response regulator, OmpR family, contains REC and winged-helix (wHTH) domain [Pedobacter rhizosphaerae]